MTNKLNAISENLTAAVKGIADLTREVIRTADEKKASILQLLSDLGEARNTLSALSSLCKTANNTLSTIGADSARVSDIIDDSFYGFEGLPEGSYASFVGFCDDCGKELHNGDSYEPCSAFGVICDECVAIMREEGAAMPTDEDAPAEILETDPTLNDATDEEVTA